MNHVFSRCNELSLQQKFLIVSLSFRYKMGAFGFEPKVTITLQKCKVAARLINIR
jgi:hypothetical protein